MVKQAVKQLSRIAIYLTEIPILHSITPLYISAFFRYHLELISRETLSTPAYSFAGLTAANTHLSLPTISYFRSFLSSILSSNKCSTHSPKIRTPMRGAWKKPVGGAWKSFHRLFNDFIWSLSRTILAERTATMWVFQRPLDREGSWWARCTTLLTKWCSGAHIGALKSLRTENWAIVRMWGILTDFGWVWG